MAAIYFRAYKGTSLLFCKGAATVTHSRQKQQHHKTIRSSFKLMTDNFVTYS